MRNIIFLLFLMFTTSLVFSQETKTDPNTVSEEVSYTIIEHVPLYKGCDENDTNIEKKKCLSSKIKDHVASNFNVNVANSLGLPNGKQKINCFFTIDKDGSIINVKVRASHPKLEAEGKRVVKSIPKLSQPGFQRGKPVKVTFFLPIAFNVDNAPKSKQTLPLHKKCSEDLDVTSLKICNEDRIRNFIKLSFDSEIAAAVLPQAKYTKFLLTFDINKKGKVVNVNAKANHKAIAIEAIRTAKRLPKFKKPGYDENGKPIITKYSLEMKIYF